jgi:hypothetical protein
MERKTRFKTVVRAPSAVFRAASMITLNSPKVSSLTGIYFQGSAPALRPFFTTDIGGNATVYYLPGTTGWDSTFDRRPTALWLLPNPLILNNGAGFGLQNNGFSFTISWARNVWVVVEACTDLAHPTWSAVATDTLTDGSAYFSDPDWQNYPRRFYRLRSP